MNKKIIYTYIIYIIYSVLNKKRLKQRPVFVTGGQVTPISHGLCLQLNHVAGRQLFFCFEQSIGIYISHNINNY